MQFASTWANGRKMLQVYKVSVAFADTFTNVLLTGWYM